MTAFDGFVILCRVQNTPYRKEKGMKRIILASASPRRRELLRQIGIDFEVMISDKEEPISQLPPEEACIVSAVMKGEDVALQSRRKYPGKELLIISADTVVAVDGKILGKPKERSEARHMLSLLSGRRHRVYTGVAVLEVPAKGLHSLSSFFEETLVEVAPLSGKALEAYLDTGESGDKAGAYGIQGVFARHIVGISGDYYNVMGLPVGRLYREYLEKEQLSGEERTDLRREARAGEKKR